MKTVLIISVLCLFVGCDFISSDDDKSTLKFEKKEEVKKDSIEVGTPDPKKPAEVDPSVENDPYYALIKQEVLVKNCTDCHNAKTAEEKDRVDLTDKEIVKREFDSIIERMVRDPGARGFMPPKRSNRPPVKVELINLMRVWKEKGF